MICSALEYKMQNCVMPLLSLSIHAVIECPRNDTQTL